MSSDNTDPVEAADDERDLYGISSWERRSLLDAAMMAVWARDHESDGIDESAFWAMEI